jgi:hypothetical protein
VLTGAVSRSSKRSLIDRCAVSGPVPCSGAQRRGKVLDEVRTAIPGGEAAGNAGHQRARAFCDPLNALVGGSNSFQK